MKRILLLFMVSCILLGCDSYKNVSNQNLYFSYRKEFNTLHPHYSVYNESDSISRLFYKFNWSEFLFIKSLQDDSYKSSAKLNYRLLKDYESKLLLDSGTVLLTESSKTNTTDKTVQNVISVNTKLQAGSLLEITLTDLNRNQFTRQFIPIDKSTKNSRQYFYVSKHGTILMDEILNAQDTLTITHSALKPERLHVRFYQRNFPLAPPPYSEFNARPFEYKADSLFTIGVNDKGEFNLILEKPGFYHVQIDTSAKAGLTLFRFHPDYPVLASADELLKPLRYITSKKEYDEMNLSANKKAAIDQFWLSNSGSGNRAKELIKTYYNRVQDANEYFGSYLEGWKTDRGLIYIIYGPPTAVYRTNISESWVYGEENNLRSLHFSFVKVINPFTENDYSMIRNENYKDSWYMAVDTWRQGRVFSD